MKKELKNIIIGTLILALVSIPMLTVAAETNTNMDDWKFEAQVYLWGADIGGQTVAGDDLDISFSDLMDNLDMAFMGTLVASKGKWVFLGDYIYLDVEDSDTSTANIIGRPERTKVDIELKANIATLQAGHAVLETESTRINMMLGARYLKLEADLEFEIGALKTKPSDSDDVWDAIVGIGGQTTLSPKWYLTYYGDIGTGQSDLTWQTSASIAYRFNKFDVAVGYRYLDYEFDGKGIIDDLNISGPYAGIRYQF